MTKTEEKLKAQKEMYKKIALERNIPEKLVVQKWDSMIKGVRFKPGGFPDTPQKMEEMLNMWLDLPGILSKEGSQK